MRDGHAGVQGWGYLLRDKRAPPQSNSTGIEMGIRQVGPRTPKDAVSATRHIHRYTSQKGVLHAWYTTLRTSDSAGGADTQRGSVAAGLEDE